MNKPLVSILMPLYNGERYVRQAIQSVVEQTYTNWELLVLNDGSTDNSEQIVREFTDERIRYMQNAENKGIVYTRNRLFELAKGDYWAILDCDDIAHPQRIAKQVAYLQQNPQCVLGGTWATKINEGKTRIGKLQPPVANENIRINQLFQSSFVQSTVMLRAEAMQNVQYNADFPVAEDFDLWEHLLQKGKGHNLPEYLLEYRWYEGNTSTTKEALMQQLRNAVLARQLRQLGKFSEQEIEQIATIGSLQIVVEKNFFKKAKQALLKLQNTNKQAQKYPLKNMAGMLAYRWVFYCVATKNYTKVWQFLAFLHSLTGFGVFVKLVSDKIFNVRLK